MGPIAEGKKTVKGKFRVEGTKDAKQGATAEVPADATDKEAEAALRREARKITPSLGKLTDGPTESR